MGQLESREYSLSENAQLYVTALNNFHSLVVCPSVLQNSHKKVMSMKKFLMHKGAEEKKKTKVKDWKMLQHQATGSSVHGGKCCYSHSCQGNDYINVS